MALTLASAARGQTCTAYAPDTGLFYTNLPFTAVSTTARTVGQYTIRLGGSSIVVTDNGATNAVVPLGASTAAYAAFYPSSGANANRFLFIDKRAYVGSYVDYTPVMIDLRAWQPGQPAQDGNELPYQSYAFSSNPQLHVNPSPGNGLAVLVWYGTNQILAGAQGATIRRSDSAAVLCTAPSFNPAVQVVGEATSTTVRIKDGGTIKSECALPRGSLDITPNSRSYGTILANATSTQSFTFRNAGTDCLNVTAIAPSAHFAPSGFAPFGLAAGASRSVNVAFNPAGAIGTFNETITVTRSPAAGEGSIGVSGTSTVTVSVSPSSATVPIGGTQQFQAAVAGSSNTAVTWSVTEGAAGGTVTSGGLYTAPAVAGTYHVLATSVAYPTQRTTVTVTVPAVQVVVSPATATVLGGHSTQLTATVTGTTNTDVTWSVQEGAAGGTVTSTGLYTAPMASGTYHVVATSVQDPTKQGTATLTVPAVQVGISPAYTTVFARLTAQFTATVSNATDTRVTWSVLEGAAGGSVSSTGLYTAPSAGGTYHVVATSVQDPGKSAMATIEVREFSEVSFVGAGSFSENGQPTFPSGVLPNDLLIVRALTSTAPAGWAAYGPIFWKRFAAGDGTPSFGAGVHAQMAAFRGVATVGSPFEALGQTLRIATYVPDPPNITSAPPITTVTDGSMVLLAAKMTGIADGGFSWIQFGNPISGPARSLAFVWDLNPGPTSEAVGLWYGLKVPAGSTGTGAVPQVSYDLEGEIEYTSVLLAVRPPALYPPTSPASLTGPATDSDGSYTLSWSAASGFVGHYELYENGALVQSVSALSATITGRAFGTYGYRVQACNEAGCSTPSAEFVVTVAPPSGITFVGAGGSSSAGKPSLPSFYDVNDILVAVTVGNAATPPGWTRQAPGIYWKRAASGESTPSFGAGVYAQMAAYRGCVTTGNPFEVTGATVQGTVVVPDTWFYVPGAQSITTLSAGAFVLLAAGVVVEDVDDAQTSVSDPASDPARTRAFATAFGQGWSNFARAIGLWHDPRSTAGPTGDSPGNHVGAYGFYDGIVTYTTTMLALTPAN